MKVMVALICRTDERVYRSVESYPEACTQDRACGGHRSGNQPRRIREPPRGLRGFGRRWLDGAAVSISGACDLAAGEALEETNREGADDNRLAIKEGAMREPGHC